MAETVTQQISEFTESASGRAAMEHLASQGYSPAQAQQILASVVPALDQALKNGTATERVFLELLDPGSSHLKRNFFSAAMSAFLRGKGLRGAVIEGLQGAVGGHLAEVLAKRFGLSQKLAGTLGALLAPMIIEFLRDEPPAKEQEPNSDSKESPKNSKEESNAHKTTTDKSGFGSDFTWWKR